MTEPTTKAAFGLDMLDTATKANDGEWCPIMLPNGAAAISPSGVPIRLKLRGQDSQPYQQAILSRTRIAMAEAQKRKPGQPGPVTDGIKETVDILVACVAGWEGVESANSTKDAPKPIACVESAVRQVLTGYALIRDQADRFISDRANFLLVPLPN